MSTIWDRLFSRNRAMREVWVNLKMEGINALYTLLLCVLCKKRKVCKTLQITIRRMLVHVKSFFATESESENVISGKLHFL